MFNRNAPHENPKVEFGVEYRTSYGRKITYWIGQCTEGYARRTLRNYPSGSNPIVVSHIIPTLRVD